VVKIPPGVESGAKLRLRGQGEAGEAGGPRGDLTIVIEVEPHPYFKREGRNLLVEVPTTIAEAVLGAKVDVPTLDGKKSLTIPPGSSCGQKLRLKGQGVPASGGKPAGDLFLILKIVVPKNVDEPSKRLIREFDERNPLNPRAGLW
jgi:DnaJ-class molecular chaperone